ncbi:MAG: TetR/AcrR family transcriptional regulator [Candidatus Marinimicrobia bacterium]|nr:TetR/AcrR family transcriptional regulator [Candidatus Neomarinimicrobiota bacterium]
MKNESDFPLRQRKYARTKLALLDAVLERLAKKPLEEITVRELCADTEVSEATFFNYFPTKTDLLVYYIQLWTIEVSWYVEHEVRQGSALKTIEAIFVYTAMKSEQQPAIMGEIIAYQARMSAPPTLGDVTPVERIMAFPDCVGVESLPARGLTSILPGLIEKTVQEGELPRDTDGAMVLAALTSIFFGVPIVQRSLENYSTKDLYIAQLRTLWAGLKSRNQNKGGINNE